MCVTGRQFLTSCLFNQQKIKRISAIQNQSNVMLRQKIRKTRLYSGIKQQEMSKLIGISNSRYCKMENGHIKFEKDDVIKIAKILQLDENELIKYWIADNIYDFTVIDKQLTLDAIKIVTTHLNDYETLVKTPENPRPQNTNPELSHWRNRKSK